MINKELKEYIEKNIFPKYEKYYSHGMIHINNVINNVLMLADYYNLDKNMCYVIASFHDVGLNIDRENGLLIIGVSDVDGIQSIEVNLNGSVHFMDDINLTEARFSLSLVDGTNTISIKITNVNGLTAEGATEFEY